MIDPQLQRYKKLLYFLSWPTFISSVGRISFPQLAVFYFLSWPTFISSVGRILFPQLADFRFLSWLKLRINKGVVFGIIEETILKETI